MAAPHDLSAATLVWAEMPQDLSFMKAAHSVRGASPASFATAMFWFLVASARSSIAYARIRSDAESLAEVQKGFSSPRGPAQRKDLQPVWFEAWNLVLHNQIDGLVLAITQRPTKTSGLEPDAGPTLNLSEKGSSTFNIAMVGDSTMRVRIKPTMQTRSLAWLLWQRDELTCKGTSLYLRCSTAGGNGGDGGTLSSASPVLTISIKYYKTITGCQADKVDADFVYFGCGLRLLQLIPERGEAEGSLDAWVNYERSLEEAVQYYRAGGSTEGKRIPVGEAFMTTHSFADEMLDGKYAATVQLYEARNETMLNKCREKVGNIELLHADWDSTRTPEDICTLGTFDSAGVLDLNRRAEPLMTRLGVPMVRAYDITDGQLWATFPEDGRHYPSMIPVELNSFLSEITTALRIEQRAFFSGVD